MSTTTLVPGRCHKFRSVYGMEHKVLHYEATSNNASYATSTARGVRGTYNSDLVLPPTVLEKALRVVHDVQGNPSRYRFRTFWY